MQSVTVQLGSIDTKAVACLNSTRVMIYASRAAMCVRTLLILIWIPLYASARKFWSQLLLLVHDLNFGFLFSIAMGNDPTCWKWSLCKTFTLRCHIERCSGDGLCFRGVRTFVFSRIRSHSFTSPASHVLSACQLSHKRTHTRACVHAHTHTHIHTHTYTHTLHTPDIHTLNHTREGDVQRSWMIFVKSRSDM